MKLCVFALISYLVLAVYTFVPSASRELQKRSFSQIGCLGVYDKAKFTRLDRICEECYQLFREPELHSMCLSNCFRNDIMEKCIDTLMLGHESNNLSEMVSDVYGKK